VDNLRRCARDSANPTLPHCTTLKSLRGNASIALPDRLEQNKSADHQLVLSPTGML